MTALAESRSLEPELPAPRRPLSARVITALQNPGFGVTAHDGTDSADPYGDDLHSPCACSTNCTTKGSGAWRQSGSGIRSCWPCGARWSSASRMPCGPTCPCWQTPSGRCP